ncbi:endonuclease/exonuclease/phosphatase family protein [Sulfitobacter sediminilitoris]|uniref:endonuclease/exonuclease/phosphatase family protein n=1 Tax=Sulfitobacter sediminilitoris TaxID=2698830 RepID=UPI0036153A6F
MRVATLNVQNLRLKTVDGQKKLHGAWDADAPEDERLDPIDRRLTAELLAELDADVVALQEVFDLQTLDYFHREYLQPAGAGLYEHRICLPGNDGRGLNVAIMSRRRVASVESHVAVTLADLDIVAPDGIDPERPIFRRDCLMVTIGQLTCVICHFKSPYPNADKAWKIRRMEAVATRRLIEQKFRMPQSDLWIILGDLNEPRSSGPKVDRAIAPLETEFSVDLMMRIPEADRWTYYDPHSDLYHCPDAMLASPALAEEYPTSKPKVICRGLGTEASRFKGGGFAKLEDTGLTPAITQQL